MATIKELQKLYGFKSMKINQKGDDEYEVRMYFKDKQSSKLKIDVETHEEVFEALAYRGKVV